MNEMTFDMTVRISDCDASGRYRPSVLLTNLQELGEIQAAGFGLSRADLIAHGMCWVLYRQRVVMERYPTYGETFRMTTWPGEIAGPSFQRHYVMERPDGAPVGSATTSWVLINIETRRPLRPSALPVDFPGNGERTPPLPPPSMLRVDGAKPIATRAVTYSDLDINGHMNNTRYIDWICDTLDLDKLLEHGLADFQINYIAEARPGDVLSLDAATDGGGILTVGRRGDGRTVFEARTVYGG